VGHELDEAWTLILQNAAHDTACGSGIDAVAEASRRRSTRVIEIAERVVDHHLPQLAGAGQVWNPSPFPRQGLVEVEGALVLTPVIPGGSVVSLTPMSPAAPASAQKSRLENGHLACDLLPDGTLAILDRRTGLHYNGLHRLVDDGDAGDEYNFSPPAGNRPPTDPVRHFRSAVLEEGPLRARLEARYDFAVFSGLSHDRRSRGHVETVLPIRLTVSLEADRPRLDIELEVINRAEDHRLRTHFPLPFRANDSAADTAFHVTARAVAAARRDPGADELELPTYPMWSFVDVSDGRAGFALIANGLHEYEVLPGPLQELALTLLRSVGWLSRDDLITRRGHAGPAMETPDAQVPGGHRFRYSLFFHAGGWLEGGAWRAAESALLPLVPGRGPSVSAPAPVIELEPDCIQLSALLPQPGGYDLRLLNASDASRDAIVRLQPVPGHLSVMSLGGVAREQLAPTGGVVRIPVRPWEIVTLRATR
jgi:alpha-mannosidase